MSSYSIFFVLNGLQDGERGVYARTATWDSLMLDGWYYVDGDAMNSPDEHGPYLSRDEAVKAAEKGMYAGRAAALPDYLRQAIMLMRREGWPTSAIKLLRSTGDYSLLEAKKICEYVCQ